MRIYEVTHWVNFNEYLIIHNVKSNKVKVVDNKTIQLDGEVEIVFNEDIQTIVDTKENLVIFENNEHC